MREENGFTRQPFNQDIQRQILTINPRCKGFSSDVFFTYNFSGITTLAIRGDKSCAEC